MHLRTVFCLCFLVVPCPAQVPLPAVPAPAQRYLDILIKRPRPGTLFERFYAAWLEEGTAADLGGFLTARTASATATGADHLLLAVYHSHRGDDRAALGSYEAALKIDPANIEAWVERSKLEARALDFAAALESLDEAAKAKPDATLATEIGKLRGRALLRLGQNEQALKVWKELAAAHAEDEDLAEEMIDLLSDEGQYEAAMEAGQALVKRSRDPVSKTLRQLRLTDILLLAERRDEALKTLRDALAATGADTWIEGDVLSRMARVFRMGDDVTGLEKYLAALVVENPQRVALAWQHTQLLGETGQKDAALAQARKLLQSNPGRRDLMEDFLDLLESLDLIKEAVAQAQVLVQQNSADKELLVRLATLQHRAGEDTAARTTLEGFLKVPGVGEADYLRVARLLENWEDLPTSERAGDAQSPAALAYVRLVEQFPDSIAAHEAQAHYLHRTGRREAALAIWTRLAKTAALEDLLRIAQALQARLESRSALDLLMPREQDFPGDARFYALLVQLGIANKELERALPWALTRLRFSKDAEAIELAIKDVLLVLRGEEDGQRSAQVMQKLQSETALTIQDRCLLASLFEDSGKGADAEKTLAAAQDADRLIALNQLTQLFQTRQDWEKAAQTLQQVIELPDARTSARVQRMVDFYRRAMKQEEALKWIAEWKKLSPSAVQPWLDESRLLLGLNRSQDALALLRDALRKFPDSVETASSYATLCLETGQPDEAERTYLALYEKTTDATVRLRLLSPLALAAQQHNALPRLIENFQQRQKQNRASAQPWMALAEIQRVSGNDEERRRCLYEASRLRPQDLDLLLEIARSEEEVGLTAEALRTLEAAAKLDKTSKTREQIARLQIDSGDADAGYRMLFEVAGGDQMDARGIEQMADTIAEKGEWGRVITFLEPLLPKHPKDYRLHYLNAIALEEEGRDREAVRIFLLLLNLHEEVPGLVNTGRSIGLRQQYASRNLPPGAEDWLVLPGMMQYAYAHRQKVGRNSRGGYYSGYSGQVNNGMPRGFIEHAPGVAESPVLALAHLLQIAGGWDVQERTALVGQLTRAGVSEAALLLEAAEISPRLIITPEMLVAHPQNVTLHTVWLMQNPTGDPDELLPVYENAWKLFESSDPMQARSIAQRAWAIAGDRSGPWLARILSIVEKMPSPDIEVFRSTAAMLQSQISFREDVSVVPRLAPEDVRRLADRLLGWYRDKPDGCDAGTLVGALVAAKNWEGVFEILKIAMAPSKASTLPSAPQAQLRQGLRGWGGQGFQNRMVQPQMLYAPPGFGVNFANFTSLVQGLNNYREDVQGASEMPEAARALLMEMREGLRPFVAKADDPHLRFILRLYCGDEEAIEKDLAVRLESKAATADDFLTAAWISQRGNKHAEAVERLTRALKLTTDEGAKLPIENALLYHAQHLVQNEQDETKTASVRSQVKELLDAHLQTAKSDDEKYQIAQLMAGVGYATEAQAIQEAVQAARNRLASPARQRNSPVANPYSSNRSYYQRQQQPQKSPEQLLKEGKTDLALKESTRQLRSAIQQTISPQTNTGGHQQLHQVMNEAVRLKLWDDVAKVLRDAANGGWRSRLEYAVMLEHVGNDTAIALAEHRSVIATNPRAYDSRVRLAVILSYEGKFEEAVQHWGSLPVVLQEQYLAAIVQEFTQRHQYAVPHPEALSGLLCAWLKGLDPKRTLSMNMVQQFQQTLQSIQQADSTNNMRYPSLYEPWRGHFLAGDGSRWKRTLDGGLDLSEASAKDRAMRRRAHDDLCRAMIQVPELSQLAFPPLAGVAQEEGEDLAALEPVALDLLTRLSMPKVKRRLAGAGIYNANAIIFFDRSRIAMPDAALFLVQSAASRNDTQALDETLYPLIASVHGKQRAAYLKGYAELLMARDEGFLTAAREWLKSQAGNAINNQGGAHDEVLRLWLERSITAPLDELFVPKSAATHGYNIPQAVTTYAMTLGLRDPEAMKQFVRKVRDQWLGDDAEARRKAVADWIANQNEQQRRNSYFRQPSSMGQATYNYIQWLQNLLQQPRGLAVLEIALEDGLDASPGWLRQIAYRHSQSERPATADDFMKAAEAAGFMSNAVHFRAYDLTENNQPNTWLGNLTRLFRQGPNDDHLNAAIGLLGKRPATFGSDLLQALLVKNSRTPLQLDGKIVPFEAAQLAKYQDRLNALRGSEDAACRASALEIVLARHAGELETMSTTGQHELSILLRQELHGYPHPAALGSDLTRILAPVLKFEAAGIVRKVDQMLAVKTWNEIGQQESSFVQHFPALLSDIVRLDADKAGKAARHAVELLRASPEQKKVEARRDTETPVGRFLYTVAEVPQLLSVVFELAEANGLSRSASWLANLRRRMEPMMHRTASVTALLTDTPFVAEAALFRDLVDMNTAEATILANFIQAMEGNEAGLPTVRDHLSKQPPTFGTELVLAFLHRAAGDDRSARSFNSSKRPDDSALLAFIRKHGPDFEKLQPDTAAALFTLLRVRLPDLKTKSAQDAVMLNAFEVLAAADLERFEADVTHWLETASLTEAGVPAWEAIEAGARLLDRLAQNDKPRAIALLDQVSRLLAQHEQQMNSGQPQPPQRTQVSQWLKKAITVPELFAEIMQRAEENGAAKDPEWLSSTLSNACNLYKLRGKPQRVMTLIETAGMLNPAATFNPRPLPGNPQQRNMLDLISTEFIGNSFPGLAEEVRKRPAAFGRDLLLLLAKSTEGDREVFAKKYAEEIAGCSDEQQKILAGYFERRRWADVFAFNVPALQDEFAPLIRQMEVKRQAFLKDLLKTTKWVEVERLYLESVRGERQESTNVMPAHYLPPGDQGFYPPGRPNPAINYLGQQLATAGLENAKLGLQHITKIYVEEFGRVTDPYRKPPLDSLLHSLCSSPQLVPMVLKLASSSSLSGPYAHPGYSGSGSTRFSKIEYSLIDRTLAQRGLSSAEDLVSTLDGLGLLADADGFDPVSLPDLATRSLLGLVVWRLRLEGLNSEMRENTALLLESAQPSTFGRRLFAGWITDNVSPRRAARLDICAAEFGRVRPEAAGAVLAMFEPQFPGISEAEKLEGERLRFDPLMKLRDKEERAYLDGLIAGGRGLSVPYRGYSNVVRDELARLTKGGMSEEVLKLLIGLRQQIEFRGDDHESHYDWRLSNFLQSIQRFSSPDSAALFACQMAAGATLPGVRVTPGLRHPQNSTGEKSVLFPLWEQRGGWAAPQAAFADFMDEVGRYGIENTAGLWLPPLHDMIVSLGHKERQELAGWAAEQAKPGLSLMARELRLALSLVDATEPVFGDPFGARRVAASSSADKAFKAVAKEVAILLRDEKIAPHIRLALAGYLAGIHPGLLDEEMLQTWARHAAQAWQDDQPVTRFELESLLNAVSVLPANETWKETCALVLERWNRREEVFRQAKRRTIQTSYFPFVLRFASRSGNEATLESFLDTYARWDIQRINGILLESGDWKHASTLNLRTASDESVHGERLNWWLPPEKSTLAAMQAANLEAALLVEVVALTANDTATRVLYPTSTWPVRDDRLAAFAKKLAATSLPDGEHQRAQTLLVLGIEHPTAALSLLPQFDQVWRRRFWHSALG